MSAALKVPHCPTLRIPFYFSHHTHITPLFPFPSHHTPHPSHYTPTLTPHTPHPSPHTHTHHTHLVCFLVDSIAISSVIYLHCMKLAWEGKGGGGWSAMDAEDHKPSSHRDGFHCSQSQLPTRWTGVPQV